MIAFVIFQWIWTSIAKKTYIFIFFREGPDPLSSPPPPLPPPPLGPRMLAWKQVVCLPDLKKKLVNLDEAAVLPQEMPAKRAQSIT